VISSPVSPSLIVTSSSAAHTRAFARALAEVAEAGDRVELVGDLGAGKTEFTKGFASGLGVRDVVNSPSFTLIAEYRGRLPLFHVDLYRLAGVNDAFGAGFLDERMRAGVTVVEWADRVGGAFDTDAVELRLTVLPDDVRRIEVRIASDAYTRYVNAARSWQPG
jgi:tRNA threonylcarbamoyladenosine biosynthesis protein TsaE